jgi:hypothetical protein
MNAARPSAIRLLGGLSAVLALLLPGCGGGKGEVSGKVRFNGTTLSGGRVTFTSQKDPGASAYSMILEDGSYKVRGCPTGPVKITVQTVGRGVKGPGGRPAALALPARYADPEKSDLEYNVRRGGQEHDIELKP